MTETKELISKFIYAFLVKNNIDFKESNLDFDSIKENIEKPKDKSNGDFAFPCFKLSKILKLSPNIIATNLSKFEYFDNDFKTAFGKVEAVNGYLNFYLNEENTSLNILGNILSKKETYGFVNEGNGQNVVVDYSSPNIAKPFHLGHLRTTVIGRAIYNIYKELGYNCIGINYLGDWGRQFGLLIEGYNRFKSEYNIEKNPLFVLSEIYVKISKLAKDDESIMDAARENFKKLEEGNEEYLKLWKYFRDVSIKEYKRIYDILGCKFDSYNGEAYYNDKMGEVIDILDKKGVLVESQGAKVVVLNENEPPCIIVKSNGSTIYATRDLAAILDRVRTYDFKKAIYVTSNEQIHHFKQVFEVAKYIVEQKYVDGLVHVPYGMVRLKTGKMSTRDGTVIYLQDMIDEAISKAEKVIKDKNSNLENSSEIAKKVGLGALVFNNLSHNKINDIVFDINEILRFDGQTGPYIQYTYVRCNSILNKANFDIDNIDNENIKYELLNSESEQDLIKLLGNFENVIKQSADEYEPSVISRYLINVAAAFSKVYNDIIILSSDENLKNARCILVYCTSVVIKKGLSILGIECPDKM